MAFTRVDEDSWQCENYTLPSALYFYFLSTDIAEWNSESMGAVLGNCPAIQSIQLAPFISAGDLEGNIIEYDTDRFGNVEEYRTGLTYTPLVYRINALNKNVKSIGSFKAYKPTKTIGGKYNWRNESRLYNYPYMFGMLTDNLNQPIEIKYHLCPNNTVDVKVRNTISDRCSYGLFIEGYKGDNGGRMEALVSSDAHELPCSSSAYSQWFASNKNQTAQNIQNMSYTAFLNNQQLQQQLPLSTIGTLLNTSLNPLSIIGAGTSMYSNYLANQFQQQMNNVDVQNAIANNLAMKSDLKSTPATMVSMGSNIYYGLDKGSKKVHLYRFGLTEQFYEKIGFYFHRFGYKQNKHLAFSRATKRNRYYFNYVKTVGANIKLGEGIPRSILTELQQIYDNGVTIWHMDRTGVEMHNYDNDNYEV